MQMDATPGTPIDNSVSQSHRPSISKSLRFAVFKRDSFKCQYCGRHAPEVILHCDHVKAVAEGGTTDILNLVAACSDCNLGKGARNLSDHAVVSKQVNQLAALQEKREQLEMMLAWRDELNQLNDATLQNLVDRWDQFTPGLRLTDAGRASIRKLMKKYGAQAVASAMKEAADQYLEREEDGSLSAENVEKAFDYVGRIAAVERAEEREPGSRQMYWIRGILRRRLEDRYYNHNKALPIIRQAARNGVPLDMIEEAAKEATSWSGFRNAVEALEDECLEQARLADAWRVQMHTAMAAAFGSQYATDAVELVRTALSYRFSQTRLLEIAKHCSEWGKFRKWLVESVEWRHYMLSALDDALGEALSDDALCEIDDAIRAGISPDTVWKWAVELGNWSALRGCLDAESNRLMDDQLREVHALHEADEARAATEARLS
jgi:hypothetical protein